MSRLTFTALLALVAMAYAAPVAAQQAAEPPAADPGDASPADGDGDASPPTTGDAADANAAGDDDASADSDAADADSDAADSDAADADADADADSDGADDGDGAGDSDGADDSDADDGDADAPSAPTLPAAPSVPTLPDDEETLPTAPVLPPPIGSAGVADKPYFEMHGYFRFRGDWFDNLHLGFVDESDGLPFPRSLGCSATAPEVSDACSSNIRSSNIRLRVEPTINLSPNASAHFQIDILDNLVLGSTPEGYYLDGTPIRADMPIGAFSGGQAPPQAGRNSLIDGIVVKRAWARFRTPVGTLEVGRMPWHWGLGIFANSGMYHPTTGFTDYDADFGDNVDRLSFSSDVPIPGFTSLRMSVATDWGITSPNSAQSDLFANRFEGQPFDLDDSDDLGQWVFTVGKLDDPAAFAKKVEDGRLAFNLGAQFVWRRQEFEQRTATIEGRPAAEDFVTRDATVYIPDVFARVGWGPILVELEGIAVLGDIGSTTDVGRPEGGTDLRQFGGVLRARYALFEDLDLGFEAGYASGDDVRNNPPGTTNVRDGLVLPGDGRVDNFLFDFDYKIDLILYRELLGTITNTTYLRPNASYRLSDRFTISGQAVISAANEAASTPGNGDLWGVEFDGDIAYASDGFFAGIAGGLFLPGDAMDHDEPDFATQATADTAWTLQTRLGVTF